MRAMRRLKIAVPVLSVVATFAISAQAQQQQQGHRPLQGQTKAVAPIGRPATGQQRAGGPAQVRGQQFGGGQQVRGPQGRDQQGRGQQGQRVSRGNFPARNFGGHAYRGRMAWEGGQWRHEMHNGRFGWWWDVGGARYFYEEPMDGPPAYVSDVEFTDDAYADGPAVGAAYASPPGAYQPPPPTEPAASAIGGAVVGGLLGGLISGRPVGAAVGAITGGTIGAIAGAQAAARPGYYLAQGTCYYKYPSGQYVQVDPRSCY